VSARAVKGGIIARARAGKQGAADALAASSSTSLSVFAAAGR
jgi:hypothetical protein